MNHNIHQFFYHMNEVNRLIPILEDQGLQVVDAGKEEGALHKVKSIEMKVIAEAKAGSHY